MILVIASPADPVHFSGSSSQGGIRVAGAAQSAPTEGRSTPRKATTARRGAHTLPISHTPPSGAAPPKKIRQSIRAIFHAATGHGYYGAFFSPGPAAQGGDVLRTNVFKAPPAATPAPSAPSAPPAPGAPPPPPQPQLTLPMIVDAFVNTPFAKPTAQVQPVGGRTLVTLPTYVTLGWEAAGYEPGETRSTQLLGHAVDIRPVGASYLYDFGDGVVGPTTRKGGPYPTGDVTFAYRRAGTYEIRITATYTGEFSVDGGPWTPIATTVPISGPGTPLDVRTSRNELIQGG